MESYICTIQHQEINTKEAQKRHEKNHEKRRQMCSKCRLCKNNEENLQHVLAVCPSISSSLYLNARHNPVAEIIYRELLIANEIESREKHPVNILSTEKIDI